MPYHLALEEHPRYLRATVTGSNNPRNALRFLKESYEACVERGKAALLLEMNLSGPAFDLGSIYSVVAERSADGKKLRKIAYVDTSPRDPKALKFAETVAINRGVNVRLFQDLAAAHRWMEAP
jgi:hypothetical protein